MKTETIERIHKLLKDSADRWNVRVVETVHLCGKQVSESMLEDCKNAQDALSDFEDWKDDQEDE